MSPHLNAVWRASFFLPRHKWFKGLNLRHSLSRSTHHLRQPTNSPASILYLQNPRAKTEMGKTLPVASRGP